MLPIPTGITNIPQGFSRHSTWLTFCLVVLGFLGRLTLTASRHFVASESPTPRAIWPYSISFAPRLGADRVVLVLGRLRLESESTRDA